jgi:hypothetical protein
VKCDETKPDCLRCANFGRKCAGYAQKEETPPKDPTTFVKRRLLSKITPAGASAASPSPPPEPSPLPNPFFAPGPSVLYLPPTIPPGITFQDEAELQYFCHFRDVTALELAGGFSPTLWNSAILRVCHRPAIRQLVIATAAMSMAVTPLPGTLWNPAADFHRQYALQKYGQALQAIQTIVTTSQESLCTVLISALLIFCFENLQGDVTPTMTYIQSALEIIVKRLSTVSFTYQVPPVGDYRDLLLQNVAPINDELLMAFMRMDRPSLSLLCRQKGCPPLPAGRIFNLVFPKDGFEIPNAFASIEEARTYLDDIRWRMFPCTEAPDSMSTLWHSEEQGGPSPDIGAVPWHVQQWYQSYDTPQESSIISLRLALWHDAFSPLLNFAMTPAGQAMFIAAAILHIHGLSAELVLTGFFPPSFSKQRSSSFSNFHSAQAFTDLDPVARATPNSGSLSVPPNVPSHRRSSSHSSPAPTQENVRPFPTVHAILDFSRRLVAHPGFSKGFVFDIGIISSLSLVVTLCPDRMLRKEAVEVLKSMRPRREGVWDSRVCAEAGERSIAKEEREEEMIDPELRQEL